MLLAWLQPILALLVRTATPHDEYIGAILVQAQWYDKMKSSGGWARKVGMGTMSYLW